MGRFPARRQPFSNLAEPEKAPVGRFPARLWPTRSAKALTRGHCCPEPPSADGGTLLLIFPISREGKSTKIKNKSASVDAQSLERPTIRLVFPFLFVWVDSRVGHRESKGRFEPAGSTRFHLDGLDAQSLERPTIRLVFPFLFVWVDSRVGHRESKGRFEPAGSTRFHLDGLKGLVP